MPTGSLNPEISAVFTVAPAVVYSPIVIGAGVRNKDQVRACRTDRQPAEHDGKQYGQSPSISKPLSQEASRSYGDTGR